MTNWMLYGVTGYTGRLVLAEARRRGLTPLLAGRNSAAVGELAKTSGLESRAFGLEDPAAVLQGLKGVSLVLHCAGPFSATCAPMLEGCLAAGAHYLDITGEIDVFAHCHGQHDRAAGRGIVVLPGAGFDVVPTDCVAAMLQAALPDARELVLGFDAGGGASAGTAKTGIEGLGRGGRVRRDGKLVAVPLAYRTRTFRKDGRERTAMTIPWGDVYTAYVSTGIPNIETYMAVPPDAIARARRADWLRPLLRWPPVVRWLQSRAARMPGPSDEVRGKTRARVWGEVRNAAGAERRLEIDTPNGYDLTVTAALGIVARLLAAGAAGGYYTPSMLMGADYVLSLPGVRKVQDSTENN